MLLNRHRGLTNLHNATVMGAGLLFFWVYSQTIIAWFSEWIRVTHDSRLLPYFLSIAVGLMLGWGQVNRLSDRLMRLDWATAFRLAALQISILALVIFSFMFATQDHYISRLFLGSYLLLSWLGVSLLHRWLPRYLSGKFFGAGHQVRTLFIGTTGSLSLVGDWVTQKAHLGVKSVGCIPLDASSSEVAGRLGEISALPAVLNQHKISQVILMEMPKDNSMARQIVESCQATGCRLLLQHDVAERLGHPVVALEQFGQHYFSLHEEPLEEPLNRAIKRIFDILFALPVVVVVLPFLCIVVWIMQRLQSPGPLFHIRPRAGVGRRHFSMLKFRTMIVAPPDAQAEVRQASQDDARIYSFGHFLRRHSLDEFPQFWNVLTGEMSLVGPRPVMPLLDEEFERKSRAYRTRHFIKPGVTGLAQSRGMRGEIKTPEQLQERLRLDLYYLAHWSIWMDLEVAMRTLWQVFRPPPSAY